MNIIIKKNYREMSKKAAEEVAQAIQNKPNLILGLASGSTVIELYKILVEKSQKGELDFSQVTTFNLDEYVGTQIYHSFMREHLFSKINIKKENTFFPPEDPAKTEIFEQLIQDKGGIDLQILGLGLNGHIAFNEPGSSFESRTRIVNLTQTTLSDNAKFFSDPSHIPGQAVTLGIADIMEAKKILLLASGKEKSQIVSKALKGPVTEEIPASILQKHPDVTVLLDQEAAKLLEKESELSAWIDPSTIIN